MQFSYYRNDKKVPQATVFSYDDRVVYVRQIILPRSILTYLLLSFPIIVCLTFYLKFDHYFIQNYVKYYIFNSFY
jgi:hypothetical protein